MPRPPAMTTVLLGWELGAGLGHVMRAAAFARGFAAAGLDVVVAAPDVADVARVEWPRGARIVPAPQPRRLPQGFADASTYAELIYGSGYHDGNQVAGLLTAWFNLLDLARADVAFLDHAPSAHLAARLLDVVHVRVGTGFFAPPGGSPLPCFRDWHATDAARARDVEAHVLGVVNQALQACGASAMPTLGAALTPHLELIASSPEFDCYASHRSAASAVYIGHESAEGGLAPAWPRDQRSARRRIAAYLKADYPATPSVVAALAADYESVVYVSGLSALDRQRWQSDTLRIMSEPMDLSAAAESCDAFVCHAGAGSAPTFLAAGKPVLMLPYSAEQRVNASLIAAAGAGSWLAADEVALSFGASLTQLLDGAAAAAARQLAQRWEGARGARGAVEAGVGEVLALVQAAGARR